MAKRSQTDNSSDRFSLSRASKYQELDSSLGHEGLEAEEKQHFPSCQLPPHIPVEFSSIEEYEIHYQQTHMNRCVTCHKNFPSDHYLSLHIRENHDPINLVKKEKGEKTYSCFVEDCEKVCIDHWKRRLHCIDKHEFPKFYDFFVVNDGIDNRNSMLRTPPKPRTNPNKKWRKRQKSTSSTSSNPPKDPDVQDLTHGFSSLSFVPTQVRFGGRTKPSFARKSDIVNYNDTEKL